MKPLPVNMFSRLAGRIFLLMAMLLMAACSGQQASDNLPSPTAGLIQETGPAQLAVPTSLPTQPAAHTQAGPAGTPLPSTGCNSPLDLTPALTEGPYFTPGSPERASLIDPGMSGTKIVISGSVLTRDCQPVANALLDFWQADAQGVYDNAGYTLRGHQLTDAQGHYQLETVVPGEYPGRTEHIHVKVQAPGGEVLTTQLFFPGVTQNEADQIYDAQLLLQDVQETAGGLQAIYNFVVNAQ